MASNVAFYAVRRLTRGPRGALKKSQAERTTITSRGKAIAFAKSLPVTFWEEVQVIAVRFRANRMTVEVIWSSGQC